jgi:hypothetical protein
MALLTVGMIGFVVWKAYRSCGSCPNGLKNSAWALTGACIAMLTSIHIVPWIRVGSDIDFWIVLGALISLSSPARRNAVKRIGAPESLE